MGFGPTKHRLDFAFPAKVQQPEMEVAACADPLRELQLSATEVPHRWRVA